MSKLFCPQEELVLAAHRGGLPDPDLREHIRRCPICSDVEAAASCLIQIGKHSMVEHRLPSADQMWWRAQLRNRREALQKSMRPISALQWVALISILASTGAVFGRHWRVLNPWSGPFGEIVRGSGDFLGITLAGLGGAWNILLLAGIGAVSLLVILVLWLANPAD
jgi:hypothetical protein